YPKILQVFQSAGAPTVPLQDRPTVTLSQALPAPQHASPTMMSTFKPKPPKALRTGGTVSALAARRPPHGSGTAAAATTSMGSRANRLMARCDGNTMAEAQAMAGTEGKPKMRRQQAAALRARGLTLAQIAARLGISRQAVQHLLRPRKV